mmetsp:Transcript_22780/g.48125  ORF Transcript_22780/g.48125 Transcript_22780/m.48125 type:complete len:216 (+) Transcript_22780:96-743(+)
MVRLLITFLQFCFPLPRSGGTFRFRQSPVALCPFFLLYPHFVSGQPVPDILWEAVELAGEPVADVRQRHAQRQVNHPLHQVVEERVAHGLSRRDAVLGRVLEHLLQQIDRFRRGLVLQVLWQRAPLHLRKFHLLVVRVHQVDLLLCRRSQNFDDLDQLVHPRLSGEEGPSDDHFRHHAAHGPHVDGRRVRRRPENQLWSPVVPRANVSNVLLPRH